MDESRSDCDKLEVGAFYFLAVNAWPTRIDSDGNWLNETGTRLGEVALFGWQDIPPGVDLFLTDRAWSEYTQSFVPNNVYGDGIVTIKSPDRFGFPAGLAFGMGENDLVRDNNGTDWIDYDVNGTGTNTSQYFSLGMDGDQVFFYCQGSDGQDRPLAAFSYNGPFLQNTTWNHTYGTNTSAAPLAFYEPPAEFLNSTDPTPGMLVMPTPGDKYGDNMCWNWEFICPGSTDGSCKMDFYSLRTVVQDETYNWFGTNPDGTECSAALVPAHHWMSNALGLLLLLWFLVMF